jgi:hypothetical protein
MKGQLHDLAEEVTGRGQAGPRAISRSRHRANDTPCRSLRDTLTESNTYLTTAAITSATTTTIPTNVPDSMRRIHPSFIASRAPYAADLRSA